MLATNTRLNDDNIRFFVLIKRKKICCCSEFGVFQEDLHLVICRICAHPKINDLKLRKWLIIKASGPF